MLPRCSLCDDSGGMETGFRVVDCALPRLEPVQGARCSRMLWLAVVPAAALYAGVAQGIPLGVEIEVSTSGV